MADEYTPTTDEVRAEWSFIYEDQSTDTDRQASFDRWLAQHDSEVATRALRDAANDMPRQWCQTDGPSDWLDDRADQIESPS